MAVKMNKVLLALSVAILITVMVKPLAAEEAKEGKKDEKKEEKKKEKEKVREVGSEEIRKAFDGRIKFVLFDVRTKDEYEEEHIRSARNLPMDELKPDAIIEAAPDKKTSLVFYC